MPRKYLTEGDDTWLQHPDGRPCSKLSFEQGGECKLHPCIPEAWLWLPKWARVVLGHLTLGVYCSLFLAVPVSCLLVIPVMWTSYPINIICTLWVACLLISYVVPLKEWIEARPIGQLWYELFDFKCNLTREDLWKLVHEGEFRQLVLCMYPHGILPIQGLLWVAYCDQYMAAPQEDLSDEKQYVARVESMKACGGMMHNEDGVSNCMVGDDNEVVHAASYSAYLDATLGAKKLYGFGAVADVVTYLPFLRNLMGWFTGGSASYKHLRDGLKFGKCDVANRNKGRVPKHLYILPGGIAEIFCSTPKKNIVVMKKRYGLMRLALETGANLTPCYVFGGTDFFYNLATYETDQTDGTSGYLNQMLGTFLAKFAKKYRVGLTWWWGKYYCPLIPLKPKASLVVARAIPVEKWTGDPKKIDQKKIEDLHQLYVEAMINLFDKYKAAAGYPDAKLEIR